MFFSIKKEPYILVLTSGGNLRDEVKTITFPPEPHPELSKIKLWKFVDFRWAVNSGHCQSLRNFAGRISLKSVLLNLKESQTLKIEKRWNMFVNLPTESYFSVFRTWVIPHTLGYTNKFIILSSKTADILNYV